MNLPRVIPRPAKTFLLLGPRGTGKSTWLAAAFPNALTIDLLDSSRFLTLSREPSALERLVAPLRRGDWVVIDEIQRIPALLDEVHRLYEQKRGIHFALSGSSARKLRRAGANLLAGRALHLPMLPFAWPEYRSTWRIDQACEWGTLPLVVSDPAHRAATLAAYVDTYLKEEITAEALVRNLDPFVRVLHTAGLFNGQILNLENLARESEVKKDLVIRLPSLAFADLKRGTGAVSWNRWRFRHARRFRSTTESSPPSRDGREPERSSLQGFRSR